MSAPLADVLAETEGDLAVLVINGEVDLSNVNEVTEAIQRGLPSSRELLLDLTGVEHLDSAAIAMIDSLRASGICVHLIAPANCPAARLLSMIDVGLPLHGTRPDAAEALRIGRPGAA